jgi:hypothetical protein
MAQTIEDVTQETAPEYISAFIYLHNALAATLYTHKKQGTYSAKMYDSEI